jgi:hypothetical protein
VSLLGDCQALGDELRSKFDQTKTEVLRVVRQGTLLQSALAATPQLDEKIKLRAPYVTPLNVLQVGGWVCMGSSGHAYLPVRPKNSDDIHQQQWTSMTNASIHPSPAASTT